ncbi:MAG: SLBB domain-containing protein [Chitinophagales bacterium]|nr:SLBB domain-containing protein [Chitinophagales bacterium]MBP6153904.1 SLBB domain-containing protein [Chitinophagales bacterium]
MNNAIKKITLCILVFTAFKVNAQFIAPPLIPPASADPTVKEIFKKIEDTLRVKQGEIKVEEVKKSQDLAKGLNPRSKDADEQEGAIGNAMNATEVKGNKSEPDKLLKEAQKASETVEKLTATATLELRERLDSVDIYGFNYFRQKNVKIFNNAVDIKPPGNYILGVGDQIVVSIWGYADYNRLFYIDKDGYIQQENIGRVYLKGLTLDQAKALLRTRFANAYMIDKSDFDVSINYSRVITINVVGDVENPGSYTFPAINTAYNILAYVGGPSKSGTIREIQIKRDGKIIRKFDLYKFLFAPEKQDDIFLDNNDYVYVPAQKNIVRIEGAVNREGKYEMLPNETFDDLLKYCGNYKPDAFTKVIQIRRFEENKQILIDIDLDSVRNANGKIILKNGDVIGVRSIPEKVKNYVEVYGSVLLPGRYQWNEGDRIIDLLNKAQGLKEDAYLDEAYLVRTNYDDFRKHSFKINLNNVLADPSSEDNMLLTFRDVFEIYSKTDFFDKFDIEVKGEVRKPRKFESEKGMSLRDALIMCNGLKEEALLDKIIIYRVNDDLTEKLISFKIDTTNNFEALDTFKLKKRDKIYVLKDLRRIDKYYIEVNGMVRKNDTFPYMEGMTLADAIILAQGFKMEAASNRIEIARIANYDKAISQSVPTQVTILNYSVSKNVGKDPVANSIKLQPYDQVYVRPTPEFEYQFKVTLKGEVLYPGQYVLTSKDERLASLIERAGGLSRFAFADGAKLTREENGIGYILTDLGKALKSKSSKFNYILKAGDVIEIPAVKDLVAIRGAFNYPNESKPENLYVPYTEGKDAKFYIYKYAAGFSDTAYKRKTYVIRPNGQVLSTHRSMFGPNYPKVEKGAVIVVPSKPEKVKRKRNGISADTGQKLQKVFTGTIGAISSVLTLYLLYLTVKNTSK